MLRATIEDAALAAAKAWSHAEVEPRHVIYAICRTLAKRTELQAIREAAKTALNPYGSAVSTPVVSAAARAVLDACVSEDAAVETALGGVGAIAASTTTAPTQMQKSGDQADDGPTAATGPKEDTAAVLAELDALVGLASVKAKVRQTIAVVQANAERSKAGMPGVNPGLHLVFTGPPGTGKTTVARLVARLYASTGALTGSKMVEVTRSDLIAGYVGQTAIKTQNVIERTRPGVLFIDEAYSLAVKHESDYANECIAALVKNMEDHRREFAVIAAGYSAQMADFIHSNPGLRSRFKTFVDFPDYSPAELVQIFSSFAREARITLAPGVPEKAERVFTAACSAPDFGNARFARSLWEQAYANMAARAAEDGVVELAELCEVIPADLPADQAGLEPGPRRIGFSSKADGDI
jgi:Cdc6-like AAA superfamily ATPase